MTHQPGADKFFTLTEQAYRREIEPVCHHEGVQPRTLIHFTIELPFYFPFPDRNWYSIVTTHDEICTYQFFEHIETKRMISLPPDSPSLEINRSSVKMIYISSSEISIGNDEGQEITACFDTLIDTLNMLLLS